MDCTNKIKLFSFGKCWIICVKKKNLSRKLEKEMEKDWKTSTIHNYAAEANVFDNIWLR